MGVHAPGATLGGAEMTGSEASSRTPHVNARASRLVGATFTSCPGRHIQKLRLWPGAIVQHIKDTYIGSGLSKGAKAY